MKNKNNMNHHLPNCNLSDQCECDAIEDDAFTRFVAKPFGVTKHFGVDFHSDGGALTLSVGEVTTGEETPGVNSRTHESGWTIKGEIHDDHYAWVNEFKAKHPTLGRVEGNFEDKVIASSQAAFDHFWEHHEPSAWDYQDI